MILALAAFLRLWQAGESLWIDELHTSWVVSGKLGDVLPRAAMGNQSPLYFWGLWLLVQLTGQSEWTLRLPSLIAGIALPAAAYFLVGQVSNLSKENSGQVENLSYAALAAALLVAIDSTCIFYAQEARPYAWVMLLAVFELVLLRRLIENPTIVWRLALLANSLLLFYLHYTTAIFLAGIVVLLPMLVRLTRSPYPMKYLVIDLLLAAALAAPGVVQMSNIFERRTNWEAFVDKPSWQALFTAIPFAGWAMLGAVVVALSQLVPRVLPGNALTRGSASAAPPATSPPQSVLWYCVLLAAILIPLLLSWSVSALDAARIYHVRYLVALVPLGAAAACLASKWVPWRAVQVTALIALAGWHLYEGRMLQQFARDGRFLAVRNEDWRGALAFLNRRLPNTSAALVIVDVGLIEEPWKPPVLSNSSPAEGLPYLTYPVRAVYQVSVALEIITVLPDVMHAGRVATLWDPPLGERDLWIVIRGNDDRARQRIDVLQQQSAFVVLTPPGRVNLSVVERRHFGNVHVMRLECKFLQQ